jgi:hypothetical protein
MAPEIISRNIVPEDRIGRVHDWGEMSSFLPADAVAECEKFLRGYFRAQILLESGKKVKAKRIFDALDKATGYSEFEDSNHPLLETIDMAVRGKSRWKL